MILSIGNTKKIESFNNHFKLRVKDMLGDGDSYGDHTTYYKAEDQWQLNFVLYFLAHGMMEPRDFTYDTFNKLQNEFDDYMINVRKEEYGWDICDMMYDTLSSDPHSDYCGSLQSVEITWIDEDGVEKEVLVESNGNKTLTNKGTFSLREHPMMVEAQAWVLTVCPKLIPKTNFLTGLKEDERFKYLFEGDKMGLL